MFLPICYVDFVQEFIFDKYIFCLLLRGGLTFESVHIPSWGNRSVVDDIVAGLHRVQTKIKEKYGMCDIVKSIENCRPRPDSISIGI